ncbi:uncharacterized protein LOC113465120 [Ceratina calcarata]|uniref:Uncharacterized protein LOC113465120 n=1 Tax=Ceratina calcarata TaxID=156304 RepID=A0AAJ7WFK2_9HYME|nr:uncharacterized protein LOC113465120 [Ceratina calcarata]
MSCVHYQQSNPPKERSYYDTPYNRYAVPTYSPRIRTAEPFRSGYCAGWRPLEFQGNAETLTTARGDSPYGDTRMQTERMTPTYTNCKAETVKHGDGGVPLEKIQTKMKFLEDSNIVMQTRNQNLITENKALAAQLKEDRNEINRLEKRIALLQEEVASSRLKIEDLVKEAEQSRKRDVSIMEANGTSTTNVVPRADRGVQIWAVCAACERKLESCEKQPPTVTITKSELEVLEKDMQTLRDTIIAREEAWDKAMEREQNYRQQLTRLTTETITARHLSETRYEELKAITNTLTDKESELRSLQKENVNLSKLIAKLYNNCQRGQEGCQRNSLTIDMNEKDQRFIEDVVRRISSGKCKQKPKSRSGCSEKTAHPGIYQHSPREKSAKTIKEQPACAKDPKR